MTTDREDEREPAAPGWARQVLADRTRATHEGLHVHPHLSRLASADLDRAEYERLLAAFRGFFAAVESRRSALAAYPELGLWTSIARLDDDLARLGGGPPPPPARVDGLESSEQVLAALYVLHGSAFGASALARCVASSLPSAPRAYLSGGVDRDRWAALIQALDAAARADPAAVERMVGAAEATFRAYGRWITEVCSGATERA